MESEAFSSEAGEGPVRDLGHGLVRGQRRLGSEVRRGMESHGRSMKELRKEGLGCNDWGESKAQSFSNVSDNQP